MRNSDRINLILAKIAEIWHSHPDLRLCQILNIAAKKSDWNSNDLFYLEDIQLLEGLEILNNTDKNKL